MIPLSLFQSSRTLNLKKVRPHRANDPSQVGVAANKVRRIIMQQRDQMMSLQSASDAAAGTQVASYDVLCQGTIDRALLLLKFVPAYGRQNNPKSPSKPARAATSLASASNTEAELSPSQKWQRAALKLVGDKSPAKRLLAIDTGDGADGMSATRSPSSSSAYRYLDPKP